VLLSLTGDVRKLKDEIEQAVVEASAKKHRRYRKLPSDDDGSLCLYCLPFVTSSQESNGCKISAVCTMAHTTIRG